MPSIKPFLLERYFAQYEFTAPFLLSPSDCESLSLKELLSLADSDSLTRWENLSLGYTDSAGHPVLREEIARLYGTISVNNILVLTPEEGIFITMQALLSAGDEVIVVTPTYQSLFEVAKSIGCQLIEWPLMRSDKRWELNMPALPGLITAKTKMLVINFPNNPTGFVPGTGDVNQMVTYARNNGLWIFSDEMYRFLEHDPSDRIPPIGDLYEKGISLSGMSKAFGLPGLRIGWLATKDRFALDQCTVYKDYTTICSSAPGEILALMALRAKEHILGRNLDIIRKNLDLAKSFLEQYPHLFRWYHPVGGSITFPEWIGPSKLDRVCQELVDSMGVMVVPGIYFGYTGSHFRIGLGRLNLPQVIGELGKFLESKYGD